MDSKKRKEKILKKINKERNLGTVVGSGTSKSAGKPSESNNVGKKEKQNKESSKKAMFSNEKALKEEKLKNKILKEKSAYAKQKQEDTNPVVKGLKKAVEKVVSIAKKVRNKIKGMSPSSRYKMIGAWVVCLVFIVVVVGIIASSVGKQSRKKEKQSAEATTQNAAEETTEAVDDNPLTACNNEAITTLITNYITAMRDVNLDVMKSLDMYQEAYTHEADFKHTANVIEDYKDIAIYTKNGPYENGFMAYVVTNIKFKGVDKTCQGMLQYVVRLQEDGSYKIDTTPEDDIEDDDVSNAMTLLSQSEDVLMLIDSVNQQCEADIEADEKLKAYVEGTLENTGAVPAADNEAATTQAAEETTEAPATEAQ